MLFIKQFLRFSPGRTQMVSPLCFAHYSPIPTMGNLCTIVSSVSFAKETFVFVFFLFGSYKDKMTLEGQNGLQVFLQWSMNDRRHLGVGWCSTQLSNFLLKPCRWMCGYFTVPVIAFLSCCIFLLYIIITIPCLFYCSEK